MHDEQTEKRATWGPSMSQPQRFCFGDSVGERGQEEEQMQQTWGLLVIAGEDRMEGRPGMRASDQQTLD